MPDGGEVGAHVVGVGLRVEDVAGFAAGAGDQHRAHALGAVARHGGRALRRFVVGVRVHGEHAERGRCLRIHVEPRYRRDLRTPRPCARTLSPQVLGVRRPA